jgi:hypothetical protein
MPTQVQFRRGSSTQAGSYIGATGELIINNDLGTIHVHTDGSTAGGNVLIAANSIQTMTNKTLTNVLINGNITPTSNLVSNIGSSTTWFNTIFGVSTQAKYADLAEKYTTDANYPVGTVVVFGGTEEITTTTVDHDPRVAGVISGDPAYLMNSMGQGLSVALTGRVPCQVQGPVTKGEVLVTSQVAGVAQAIDNSKFVPGCVIGKALESIPNNTTKSITVVVGRF